MMLLKIFSLLLATLTLLEARPFPVTTPKLSGPCNSYDREKLNEGYYKCVYKDPDGIPTVGVGFNLEKFGARQEIESVGANYNAVLNGSQCLDDSQIERLFNMDMDSAVSCASSWLSNWSELSTSVESAVADMAFNLGCVGLEQFRTFKSDLENKEFDAAAADMQNSLWCRQVGSRCSRDVDCVRSG